MRFEVNLASRPFVNHLPHLLLLSGLLVAAVALTAWNLTLYLATRSETLAVQEQLAAIEGEEARLEERRRELTVRLAGVDIEELSGDVAAANDVLAERSVRWSLLLARLQELMPYKAKLTSIKTSAAREGVGVALEVRTPEADYWYRLYETLESSPCFSNVYPNSETARDGEFRVLLEARYEPTCHDEAEASEDSAQRAPTAEAERGERG